jgi:hypothetical protein
MERIMVKTKITNPTASKQTYGWACSGGVNLAQGQSITLDGDVYTHNIQFPGNIRQIRSDLAAGRVQVALITEFKVGADDAAACEQTPAPAAKPAPAAETAYSDPLKGEDTLVDGIRDVGEALAPPAASVFDAITGEEAAALKDASPVSFEDAVWGRGSFDAAEVEAKAEVKSAPDRSRYSKMSKKALMLAAVKAGGSHEMAKDATRDELADFLIASSDKESAPIDEAFG